MQWNKVFRGNPVQLYFDKYIKNLNIFVILICSMHVFAGNIKDDTRSDAIDFIKKAGLEDKLERIVAVGTDSKQPEVVSITDPGIFLIHYHLLTPESAADANVVVAESVHVRDSCDKVVIVTHGWIDKAGKDWPAVIARQVYDRVDPNEWMCAYFDWQMGAAVINPVDAAKYARDIAGVKLAKSYLKLMDRPAHVHLIGHSAGSWAVNTAAGIISKNTDCSIHITFLDAYVPPFWKQEELGNHPGTFCEHYYTKDLTGTVTQVDLTNAHNIDITAADPWIKEHEFPYRWYSATITGSFEISKLEKNAELINEYDGLFYGFERSLETGHDNWIRTKSLKRGNRAVVIKKPEKDFFKSLFGQ